MHIKQTDMHIDRWARSGRSRPASVGSPALRLIHCDPYFGNHGLEILSPKPSKLLSPRKLCIPSSWPRLLADKVRIPVPPIETPAHGLKNEGDKVNPSLVRFREAHEMRRTFSCRT